MGQFPKLTPVCRQTTEVWLPTPGAGDMHSRMGFQIRDMHYVQMSRQAGMWVHEWACSGLLGGDLYAFSSVVGNGRILLTLTIRSEHSARSCDTVCVKSNTQMVPRFIYKVNQIEQIIQSKERFIYPIRSESCLQIKFVSKLYYCRFLMEMESFTARSGSAND